MQICHDIRSTLILIVLIRFIGVSVRITHYFTWNLPNATGRLRSNREAPFDSSLPYSKLKRRKISSMYYRYNLILFCYIEYSIFQIYFNRCTMGRQFTILFWWRRAATSPRLLWSTLPAIKYLWDSHLMLDCPLMDSWLFIRQFEIFLVLFYTFS